MKKNILNIFLASAAFLAVSCTQEELVCGPESGTAVEQSTPEYLPGQVVIKFDPAVEDMLEDAGISGKTKSGSSIPTLDELLEIVDSYEFERVFPMSAKTEQRTREAGLHLWYVVRFSEDQSVEEVINKLSRLGDVQAVNPVRTIKKAYTGKSIPFHRSPLTKTGTENEMLVWQWAMTNNGPANYDRNPEISSISGYPFGGKSAEEKFVAGYDISWEAARARCKGNPSIIVAVMDEGIDLSHPDLQRSLWVNEDEIEYSLKDNDGNGYAGDYHGYNFVAESGDVSNTDYGDSGHGTHCAGTIAAVNGNEGMVSIAGPESSDIANTGVRLMSCQIFSGNLSSSTLAMVRAIKYAADNGAVILQASLGHNSGLANPFEYGAGPRDEDEWALYYTLEKDALDYFIHNAGSDDGPIKGGIAIFAAGNEYAAMAGFPGAYEKCVSVAAVAADFTPSTFSNYGQYINLAAPGGDLDYYYDYWENGEPYTERGAYGAILSSVPTQIAESGYAYMEGTSMACPHVSGVVALGLSHAANLHKHFTTEEIVEFLSSSEACADVDYDAIMTGRKYYYKWQSDSEPLIHLRNMNLNNYRGKIGAGVINANKFLDLIEGGGVPMEFPNLVIAEGSSVTVDPNIYFDGGSFSVTIADGSIAAVAASGSESGSASVSAVSGQLVFFGLKSGSTTATINYGAGSQTFAINVRSGSSWL